MRVTTALNRMLGLPGAWVRDVAFGQEAVIVTVVLRAKKPVCSGCGARGLKIKEHREKRWRALDLGGLRCVIECRLRRLYCPGCGDMYEGVPWARAGSRYTRDFEDLTAWLAQQMSQTQVERLLRIAWRTVGTILARVVADKLDRHRLDGLRFIGVDEVSYGAEHKFLTCVADHHAGSIVWATEGRNADSLQAFFAGLTGEQKASIKAVSIDMSAGYEKAIRAEDGVPHAQVVFDPFHVVQLAGKAADQVRRDEYNRHGRSSTGEGKWIKGTRYSLLKDTAKQTARQLLKLAEVVLTNKRMYRAFLLYGELRYLYKVPKEQAPERLEAWLAWASRSRLKPFVKLARTIRKHKAGVLAAIELNLSNGRLEALNSKVRLISHRAYGFHSADALIAMIYLCCAGIQIPLPHR
ncbi:MAG TPA: ISL3 family transposase [Rhizomicrobium sp.]